MSNGKRWAQRHGPAIGLYLGAALEAWFFTVGRTSLGYWGSPVAFVSAGLLVVLAAFALRPPLAARPAPRPGIWFSGWGYLAAAAAVVLFVGRVRVILRKALREVPIRISESDIIPAIRIYVRRLLWGSDVYRELTPELGYLAYPTYLPGTWLPFTLAEVGNFDYRWLAFGSLLLGMMAAWAWLGWLRRPWPETLLKAALPVALTYYALPADPSPYVYTVETLVAGYVLLLGAALLTRSVALRALALLPVLLSRYFVLIWVPLLGLLIWWEEGWRRAMIFGGLLLALLTATYLWPIWRHDPGLMARVQTGYQEVAVNEWQHLNPATGRPYHAFNGLGLAPWFYPAPATVPNLRRAVDRMRLVQLAALGVVLAGCAVGWWWHRRRHGPDPAQARWVALVSLKLFLVVFFALLHVPYAYMVLVSVYLTSLLVVFSPGLPAAPSSATVSAP